MVAMSADDLITGALPFVNYGGPSSAVISTGVAPTSSAGSVTTMPDVQAGANLQVGGARAGMTASGTTILLTWLAIVVILVASNILTLRIQG
jgi:hypothetical protein